MKLEDERIGKEVVIDGEKSCVPDRADPSVDLLRVTEELVATEVGK